MLPAARNRRVTPTRIDLVNRPTAPPHPAPIEDVFYASFRVGSKSKISYDHTKRPPSHYLQLLTKCMRLAVMLVIHPKSMQYLVDNYCNSVPHRPLVQKAIRYVLATTEWSIAIDESCSMDIIAYHARPDARKVKTDKFSARELTIFMNDFFIRLFDLAHSAACQDVLQYNRQMLFLSIALAHELTHALRAPVYMLLRSSHQSEIIPWSTPLRDDRPMAEFGWDFEWEVLGGVISGAWYMEDGAAPITSSAAVDTEPLSDGMPTFDMAALILEEEADSEDELETDDRRLGLQIKPFDLIVMRPLHADGKFAPGRFKMSDPWISELMEAFAQGDVTNVVLPIPTMATALDTTKIIQVARKAQPCASDSTVLMVNKETAE